MTFTADTATESEAAGKIVTEIAPALGLDPSHVSVRAGPNAARPSAIWVDRIERGVIAHELAHVAQHANRGRPDVTRAEAEAGGLAAAARAGRHLWLPRATLPPGRVARLQDAQGVAPDVDALRAELQWLVEANHQAELTQIKGRLGEVFTTTGEMVESTLHVLDTLPFVSARALVGALEAKQRRQLARLDDNDHKLHPRSAAAVLTALTADDLRQIGKDNLALPPRAGLHGLTASALQPDELRAVLQLLARTPESTMLDLMRGDRRDDFRALVATAAPTGTEADALKLAIEAEKRVTHAHDADLFGRVTTALEQGDAHQALDALTPLTDIVQTELGTPAGTGPPLAGERLRWVVGLLDAWGYIEGKLLDKLPENDRYERPYAPVLELLLAARNPALNLAKAESLLSYGVFDWAIRDGEARYAYLLVRSTPIAVQDEWRRRDGGLYYTRLIENLPDGTYAGLGSEFVTGAEKEAPDGEVGEQLKGLLELWRPQRNGPNAQTVLRRLLAHDDNGRPLETAEKTQPTRLSVVRRFDATPEHELYQVVNELPDRFVLDENTRQELLDLSGMRDPVQLELHAASLLVTGVTDWWVNSREAWVAYQLIRALEPEAQKRFAAADPGRWSALQKALTPEMKSSMAATVTTGRGPWPGQKELRARLSDERLWNQEHANELRALINLAYVSDDREWVFDLSKRLRADLRTGLYDVVHDLRLYNQGVGPETFSGEGLETRGGGFELLRFVDDLAYVRWILVGLGAWLFMDWVQIGGYSVQVKEFDLNWAQWAMGGDIGGARLEPDAKDPPADRIKVAGAPPPVKANRLSMQADLGTGAVRIQLPQLRLASTNFMRGGASYRSGPIRIDGLKIVASFSDRHYREPLGAEIDADEIDVQDLVLASQDLPLSTAWSLAHTAVKPFHVKTGATGDEDLQSHKPRGGTLPIPVFGPILQALANVVAIKGGIPFSPTLVDLMLMPIPDLPFGTGTVANALVPSPAPADYLWGLATDGVFRPPRTVQARIADAAQMLKSFDVSFGKLTIEGLSIGANTQIASITLLDVDIGVGLSRPAYLRTLLRSLKRVRTGMSGKQLEETDKRIADADTELKALTADEKRMEELERKDRWNPGSLNDAERTELTTLNDRLRVDSGLAGDIGRIEVGPLSGRVQSGGIVLEGIHLDAHGPLGKGQYLPDEELLARLRRGDVPQDLLKGADAHITIASTRLIGGVSVAAETLPKADELRARIDALPPKATLDIRQRLADALALIEAIDRLHAQKEQTTETHQQLLVLEDSAKRLLGTMIGSAQFGEITGQYDRKTGRLTARVHDVDVRDVYGPGFAFDRLTGEVELGGKPDGSAGSFGLDAKLEGLRTEYGSVGSVTIEGLKGDVLTQKGGMRVQDVVATRIIIAAIDLGVPGTGLTAKSVTIEGLGLDATVTDQLTTVDRLDIAKLSAEQIVYDAADADGKTVHAELRGGALTGIHVTGVEYGADGLKQGSVDVMGVEDLRYRVALGTLTGGEHTSVGGTLKGSTKKGPVIHASMATAGGTWYSLALKDLEAIGTEVRTPDGSVVIQHAKISGAATVTPFGTSASFQLRKLDLRRLDWKAGALQLVGHGAITLETLDVTAKIDAKQTRISDLTITGVAADNLQIIDKPLDVTVGRLTPLTVAKIHLTDFVLGGGSGHLDVTGFHTDFDGQFTKTLKAGGTIDARQITVDFQRGGKLVARAQGLGVNAAVDADGTKTSVSFADVDTGAIGIGPDGYTVEGLNVKEITLSQIHFDTTVKGHKFLLESDPLGDVKVKDLEVKAKIDKALTRIELTHFKIGRVELQGLRIELPDDHVKVTVLKSEPVAFFRDIVLEGEKPGEPFVIAPGSKELLRGVASLQETSIPKLAAEVKGAFKGSIDLHTDRAAIQFLEKGETKIDVTNPRARMSHPATLGSEKETIKVEELGAESITVDEHGVVKVHHTTLKYLTYVRPGVEVVVQQASVFGDITVDGPEGRIPRVDISEAKLTVDFTKLPASDPKGPSFAVGDLDPLMDGLQGQLWMTVFARTGLPVFDDQDLSIPVHLTFKDGQINFADLQAELQHKIGSRDADEEDDESYTIEHLASEPVFWTDGSQLLFGLLFRVKGIPYRHDIVTWDLPSGEVKGASDDSRVRLARLIHPVDTGKPSSLDKKTLEFHDIVANLSVRTKTPAHLAFSYGRIGGEIVFAPDALAGLTIRGGVSAPMRPLSRDKLPSPGKLSVIAFDAVKMQSVEVNLATTDIKLGGGDQPGIEIKDLREGSLTFKGHDPQLFKGTITSAIARDVHWGPSSPRRPH